jgi:hypothetical protein
MQKSDLGKIYKNVFSLDEIRELQTWLADQPVSIVDPGGHNLNKNLDYHIKASAPHRIIKPKLDKLIGSDHEFSTGGYKECSSPYQIHIDHYAFQKNHQSFANKQTHELALLIPMVEGPEFKTILFDVFDKEYNEMGAPVPESWLTVEDNGLDLNDFGHFKDQTKSQITHIPLDCVFDWHLGSVLQWNRYQLHASSNFARFGAIKKFIVIFLA